MEENEKQLNGEKERPRTKKKGTLAKLKERKEREFSSTSSLRKNAGEENNSEVIVQSKGTPESSVTNRNEVNGLSKPDLYHFSTKDPRTVSDTYETTTSHSGRPRPKPRNTQKQSSSSSDRSLHQGEESGCEDKHEDGHPHKGKECLNSSPDTDTTQRRKSFKTKEKSESIESITSGGFTPKPPVTPRSAKSTPRTPRGFAPYGKVDKKNPENNLSGEETQLNPEREKSDDKECDITCLKDRNTFDISDLVIDEVESKVKEKNKVLPDFASISKENQKLLSRRGSIHNKNDTNNSYSSHSTVNSDLRSAPISSQPPLSHNNNGNPVLSASSLRDESPHRTFFKSRRRSGSCSPARALPDKFKPPASPSSSHLSSDSAGHGLNSAESRLPHRPKAASFSNPASSETGPVNTQVLYTSNENSRSVSTPPNSARLEPVSPRSQPPPLPNDFASHSLRTSYKIDPNVRPHTSSGLQRLDGDKSDSGTASGADKVSQKSFSSGSVLPIITTKEARSRSYLEGSVSSASPSILGSEELERYFPDRKVNVLVGTWNMNELKEVTTPLDDFILPEKCDYVQDIYAIGTQENYVNKKEWEIKLQETLGPSHVMFHSATLGALHLVIFVRRDLIWFCSLPEDNAISLRAVTMVKTKGAIGISFTMFGSSFLFINCHLTSDRDNENSRKKHRMGDYFKVIQDMDFKLVQEVKQAKTSKAGNSKKRVDITALYDSVFWCGDLNFRIERQRHAVERKVNQITSEEFPNFETLLGGDQLLKYMMEGKIFNGFQEGRINFHPTFKFDVSKDTYDSSVKNRVPSYTDRVMFRSKKKNDIACLHYDAVMGLKISDHRAVFGQFEAGIKPGRDNMAFGAGHFDRNVYMEANQRRAANQSSTQKKSKPSSICSIQ